VPHGHNYTLEVTVHGDIDERTGMVIDLGELKQVVGETVVERFDHADLNADPLFRDRVPTTENIALAVWDLLVPKLGRDRLASVRVWEDATLSVEYDGA
jgi:6-pyruvoyltetrahydropterin/6-carboxytetrahydropterin synthase